MRAKAAPRAPEMIKHVLGTYEGQEIVCFNWDPIPPADSDAIMLGIINNMIEMQKLYKEVEQECKEINGF